MVDATGLSLLVAGLTAAAAVATYGFGWYSWRQASHPVSDRFALLMAADGTWALVTFLGMVSPSDAIASRFGSLVAVTAALAAVFWFTFVIEYTGDSEWIPAVVERVAVGQALLYGVFYLVNPADLVYTDAGVARWGAIRLPYEEMGPVAVAQVLLVYVLLAVTFGLLARFLLGTNNLYRKQAGVIFGATFVILLANVAFFAGLTPHPRLDITPVFFAVQAVGIGFALYYYDFLDVVPMAANVLLEEMTDPVFVVDANDRVVNHNNAAVAFLDADCQLLDDVRIEGLGAAVSTSDGLTPDNTTVSTTQERDGRVEPVTFDVRTTPIPDRYGIVRGYVVVLRDVTEREARERALESQNERLEEFTSVVSHDLRNPITVIDGRIEMALETGEVDHLDVARDAVRRMDELIDDLLALAREGQAIDDVEPVTLSDVGRLAWRSVASGDATLTVETDAVLEADPSRLQQLLENLFRNAIQHGAESGGATNPCGPSVTIGAIQGGFYVADGGPGIPTDSREEVFELGHTSAADGTGFGLAIVERIVAAHGWSVGVTESEDGGARFEITGVDAAGT